MSQGTRQGTRQQTRQGTVEGNAPDVLDLPSVQLAAVHVTPDPAVTFTTRQLYVTGTMTNGAQFDRTQLASFNVDAGSEVSVSSPGGLLTVTAAGRVYGGADDVLAEDGPNGLLQDSAAVTVIASDSGSSDPCPRMPLRASDWVALGLSPWGAFGGLQEGTGSLVLSGSAGYTLAATNSPLYAQTLANWTRKAINPPANAALSASTGQGPSAAATSVAFLTYVATPSAPAGSANVLTVSANAAGLRVDHLAGGQLGLRVGGASATSSLTYTGSIAYPLLVVHDRTHSTTIAYTDREAVSGTFSAVTDGGKGIGAVQGTGDSSAKYVYLASCTGSIAELGAPGVRSLLTTLGWTPTGY